MKKVIEEVSFFDVTKDLRELTSILPVMIEQHLFNQALANMEGYTGGSWQGARLGEVLFFTPPSKGILVTLRCPGRQSVVETDSVTAGAAMTITAINHLSFKFAGMAEKNGIEPSKQQLYHGICERLVEMYYAMHNAFFADDSPLDTKALFEYTD